MLTDAEAIDVDGFTSGYRTVDLNKVKDTYSSGKISIHNDNVLRDVLYINIGVREKTVNELIDSGILDKDGKPTEETGKCSEDLRSANPDLERTCKGCQKYIKSVVSALASVGDEDYSAFTPYIARVVGSWFRDTFFVIPKDADAAINEYSGTITPMSYTDDGEYIEENVVSSNHPEFDVGNTYGSDATFVLVDEEYLGDSGEYWTLYDMKGDDEGEDKTLSDQYQLYVLKSDGRTSNTKMEDFLKNGMIDGTPAQLYENGSYVTVTGYNSKEEAEKYGWAFVKKAKVQDISVFTTEEHNKGIEDSLSDDSNLDDEVKDNIKQLLWSAYAFDANGANTKWEKVKREDKNNEVNALYDIIYGKPTEGSDEEGSESSDGNGGDDSGVFYQLKTTNQVTQVEDAQRGETNALVKYLFKYRKFYIYDGGEARGVTIEHDKQRVLYGYDAYVNNEYDIDGKHYNNKVIADEWDIRDCPSGITKENFYKYEGLIDSDGNGKILNTYYGTTGTGWKSEVIDLLDMYGRSALRQSYAWNTVDDWIDSEELATQWLDWQLDMYYMNKYGVNLQNYYHTTKDLLKLDYDPRDPDLIGTVEITKNSLGVFSILENTGTLDAEYAYRDFKELIVELNYFDKEELSTKYQDVFSWILPEVTPMGWPNRPWDKLNVDYGTLVQSLGNYELLGTVEKTDSSEDESDSEETSNSSSSAIDKTKLCFIGDSWMEFLKNYSLADSPASYNLGVGSSTSKNWLNEESVNGKKCNRTKIPKDASGIVISLGLNDRDSTNMKELIKKLKEENSGVPIIMLKASHVAETYTYMNKVEFNKEIDTYNNEMATFCQSESGVQFVDPTKDIIGEDGYLKKDYATSDGLHLEKDGCKIWYDAIISGLDTSAVETLVSFQGYEADQKVVSPVTGKVIEIGQHERLNVYTGAKENVEYIKIKVIDNAGYFNERINDGQDYGYETETEYDVKDALNSFYKEYQNVCDGYTVILDGFDVDFSVGTPEDETPEYPGNYGEYDKENYKVTALFNSKQKEEREAKQQAKVDAPYFISYGEGDSLPQTDFINFEGKNTVKREDPVHWDPDDLKGYYVKEGKYIGKTVLNDEEDKENMKNNAQSEPTNTEEGEEIKTELEDKLTYTYEDFADLPDVPADYMRLQVIDTDEALVDDVERFFQIPTLEENNSKKFNGKMSEEFLYWMLVFNEGGYAHLDSSGQYGTVFDLGDGCYSLCFGVTNWCRDYFLELGYDSDIPDKSSTYCGWQVGTTKIKTEHIIDVAIAFIDAHVAELQATYGSHAETEGQLSALMSVVYNFGSVPSSLHNAIMSNSSDLQSVWEHLSDGDQFAAALAPRRRGEYKMYSTGQWIDTSTGEEMHFKTSTPFSDYVSTRETQHY